MAERQALSNLGALVVTATVAACPVGEGQEEQVSVPVCPAAESAAWLHDTVHLLERNMTPNSTPPRSKHPEFVRRQRRIRQAMQLETHSDRRIALEVLRAELSSWPCLDDLTHEKLHEALGREGTGRDTR